MNLKVEKSEINGSVRAPSSKSVTIRALVAGLLAEGQTTLLYPSLCDDALAVGEAITNLGAGVVQYSDKWVIRGGMDNPGSIIEAGESGLAARMFVSIAALTGKRHVIAGKGSLAKRSLAMVVQPLKSLGVDVTTNNGFVPVEVQGPLRSGTVRVDASKSSQFLSGLLMALPVVEGNSLIYVGSLASKPYIDLTLSVLGQFGVEITHDKDYRVFEIRGGQTYSPVEFSVEGDWSGAAFLLVAGAIAGSVDVHGLDLNSSQADRAIMEALELSGVDFETGKDVVSVKKSFIRPFEFDITHCPDLAPPLVALASYASGTSIIYGAERLYNKESNRAVALVNEASKLGINIDLFDNKLVVHGGKVRGGTVNTYNDHRMAMFAAVMALGASGTVVINGAQCVSKSYPLFFEDLKKLGGQVYE